METGSRLSAREPTSSSAAARRAAAISFGSRIFVVCCRADEYKRYPHVDHVHFYGCYIGNYPTLPQAKILRLCELLNGLTKSTTNTTNRTDKNNNARQCA